MPEIACETDRNVHAPASGELDSRWFRGFADEIALEHVKSTKAEKSSASHVVSSADTHIRQRVEEDESMDQLEAVEVDESDCVPENVDNVAFTLFTDDLGRLRRIRDGSKTAELIAQRERRAKQLGFRALDFELDTHILIAAKRMTGRLTIIVGCSQGFGKAILRESLSSGCSENTHYILIAQSSEKVRLTWSELRAEVKPDIEPILVVHECDLSDAKSLANLTSSLQASIESILPTIDAIFVFMNSGSVTPVGPIVSGAVSDAGWTTPVLADHASLNFISFVQIIKSILDPISVSTEDRPIKTRIVNVSSLAAIQPLYGMSIYGAIKCAREYILRSLKDELARDFPSMDIKLLNYAPGPMDTELVRTGLLGSSAPDNFVKSNSLECVSADTSARKLFRRLANDSEWDSCAHIDYFDV